MAEKHGRRTTQVGKLVTNERHGASEAAAASEPRAARLIMMEFFIVLRSGIGASTEGITTVLLGRESGNTEQRREQPNICPHGQHGETTGSQGTVGGPSPWAAIRGCILRTAPSVNEIPSVRGLPDVFE